MPLGDEAARRAGRLTRVRCAVKAVDLVGSQLADLLLLCGSTGASANVSFPGLGSQLREKASQLREKAACAAGESAQCIGCQPAGMTAAMFWKRQCALQILSARVAHGRSCGRRRRARRASQRTTPCPGSWTWRPARRLPTRPAWSWRAAAASATVRIALLNAMETADTVFNTDA